MNITPQPYAHIELSLHKTDDLRLGRGSALKLSYSGKIDDCVCGIALAMRRDPAFALLIKQAIETFNSAQGIPSNET